MSNKGLLHKALVMNEDSSAAEEADRHAGISPEDRKEITAQIEEITRKNRIDVGPEQFRLSPLKKGFIFPLAVNVLAIAFTGSALWGLSTVFSEREAAYSSSGAALASAEGKLIQELKKDSESRISEKEKEIAEFQTRLAAMEKEQSNLQASFEQRIAGREAELRSQMEKELEKERARLMAEGLSEAVIQERLKKFEEERLAGIRKELADYQKKLDAEKAAAEANYARLRDEYKTTIGSLNEERKRIQDESKKREDALRASLEAKTQELESRSQALAGQAAQASAGLEQAKAELARIGEQSAKATAAEDQIVGLYLAVQAALRERRYEDAAARSASLRSYLTDPSLAGIASLDKRRQADLFAADALSQLAGSQLERTSTDTTLLLSQAELVASIRNFAEQARNALAAGQNDRAAEAYTRVLGQIPEVLQAHAYFTDRNLDETGQRRQEADLALTRAGEAAARNDYDAAAAAYAEAAAYLGLSAAETTRLVDGVGALASARGATEKAAADTRAAQNPLNRAKRDLDAKKWNQSVDAYAQVLAQYPQAAQKPEALKGIDSALAGLAAEADAQAREDKKKARELEAEISRLSAELSQDAERSAVLNVEKEQSALRVAELERLLEEARAGSAAAAQSAPGPAAAKSPEELAAEARLKADLEQARAENARLAQTAGRYDTMLGSYSRYQRAEDAALARGSGGLIDARTQLDAFLTDAATRQAFPDLRERIARYEQEFVSAGQKESIYNAQTIAENALRLKDAASRERYFQDVGARYRNDAEMQAYIEALKRGLR